MYLQSGLDLIDSFVTQSYFTPFMVRTGTADAWLKRFLLRLVNFVWFGLPEASLMTSRMLRAGVTDHPGLRAWCQVSVCVCV